MPGENIAGRDDATVRAAAQQAQRFLVTRDLDFSDVRQYAPGTHQGLTLVRLLAPSRRRLAEPIQAVFRTESVGQWHGCFVVVTDRKVRVWRP